MKVETVKLLANARAALSDAERVAAMDIAGIAAREAYIATLYAAQAAIFDHFSAGPKSHRGVRARLTEIIHNSSDLHRELAKTLTDGYQYKHIADYTRARVVRPEEATRMIDRARSFIAEIEAHLLARDASSPR